MVETEKHVRYILDRETATAERIPPEALPHLLAAFYSGPDDSGCPDAFDELNRGFAYLCFQVAERVASTHERRLALLPVMSVDMGEALLRCRKQRKPAHEVEAYLARALSNSPKHADDLGFVIIDSHKGDGKDRGRMRCRQSSRDPSCDQKLHDHRAGKVKKWRKPRGETLPTTLDDDRERRRSKNGWYTGYIETAQAALRLTLDCDQREIARLAADGNSPEEICRMLKLPEDYVNTFLDSLKRWVQAAEAERARRSRLLHLRPNRSRPFPVVSRPAVQGCPARPALFHFSQTPPDHPTDDTPR
jgi:hypothetical protein